MSIYMAYDTADSIRDELRDGRWDELEHSATELLEFARSMKRRETQCGRPTSTGNCLLDKEHTGRCDGMPF